ncbi:MAG: S1/P1 nuclease [Bryobacteraceae bacterium]
MNWIPLPGGGVPEGNAAGRILEAATWADRIKSAACSPGYTSDGGNEPPGDTTDARNIGYADRLMHKYWHFIDVPLPAGAPGAAAKTPNALTEIALLEEAIGGSESDEIKSYDLAWLEHLVGDLHQPLHCAARYTPHHPKGDAGGNFIVFCEKPCRDNLHAGRGRPHRRYKPGPEEAQQTRRPSISRRNRPERLDATPRSGGGRFRNRKGGGLCAADFK